jgi:NitT/TauT family transport system permease protein
MSRLQTKADATLPIPSGLLHSVAPFLSFWFTRSIAIIGFIAVWEIVPRLGLMDTTFLPPFSEVIAKLLELLVSGDMVANILASLYRSLAGLTLAVLLSVPLGLLIGWYGRLGDILSPLLEIFRNTAALALLPVFILILGLGETSKISMVLYACVWPILLNTISAVRNVDPLLIKSARSMGLTQTTLFLKVVLPASLPTIFTGVRLAGASSILVLIACEMAGAREGLGYLVNFAQFNFQIPTMYAGIIMLSAVGLTFNYILLSLERRLTRWKPERA